MAAGLIGLVLIGEPGRCLHAQETAARLNVREVWRTTGEGLAGGPIGAIAGMTALDDGTVWVSDGLGRRIVSLSPDGEPKDIAKRFGDGPGEFRSPGMIARDRQELAVYDVNRGSVDVFGAADGAFRRRIQLPARVTWAKGFTLLPGPEYVLSGGIPGSRHAIHRFHQSGRLLDAWDRTPETRDWMAAVVVAGGPLTTLPDGSLLYSRAAPHEIVRYQRTSDGSFPAEGTTLASQRDILRPVGDDAIATTYEDGVRVQTFRAFARSIGVFVLSNGSILNVVAYLEEGRTLFQLYDANAQTLIATQQVARAYTAWHITPRNELLVSYLDAETDESVAALLRLF